MNTKAYKTLSYLFLSRPITNREERRQIEDESKQYTIIDAFLPYLLPLTQGKINSPI